MTTIPLSAVLFYCWFGMGIQAGILGFFLWQGLVTVTPAQQLVAAMLYFGMAALVGLLT